MSLDIWLGQHVDYGGPDGPEFHEVFSANITHNLSRMWRQAGVHEALYESEGKTAADIWPVVAAGVEYMRANREACEKHNAPNGWGLYEHALPWLERLAEACRKYPRATVRVSR